MKIIKMNTKKVISVILTLIFSISSILILFPLNPAFVEEDSNKLERDEKSTEIKSPFLSIVGEDPWWNSTFYYRQLINITNPYDEAFTNFICNITFNYTTSDYMGKMNDSFKDVRIVENGALRNYFVQKDYPRKDFATVWFETDISAGPNTKELDTYLYYGNENASFDSSYLMDKNPDGLIWYKFEEIKNGEVIDSMGNYNATVINAVLSDDSAVGNKSMSFDGSVDYLAIQDLYYQGHYQIPNLTLCVWFKTSESGGIWNDNWAFFDFDRSEYFNFFIRPNDGRLGFSSASAYDFDDYNDQISNTQNLNNGEWHFGCAKYDGNDKYIYIDNGAQDDIEVNPHGGNPIGVGDDADFEGTENNDDPRYGIIGDGSEATTFNGGRNQKYYNGLLDEIRFFEDSLSPERIYWIANDFKLNTSLNEKQNKEATVEITVKDLDGRVVPNATVFVFNSTNNVNYTQITDEYGYTEFGSVENLIYNIRVNYTVDNGTNSYEEIVYDSIQQSKNYSFTELFYTIYIETDLWSIDFEIEDWDYEPMGYGYVLVYNSSDYSMQLANLTLDKEFGTTTFRGINTTNDAKYYYEIYYENQDYTPQKVLVNSSVIDRTEYLLNRKLPPVKTKYVNQTDIDERSEYFLIQERIYAAGSNTTHIGNTKIINTTIILSEMYDSLDRVEIYQIDQYNNESTVIYTEDYSTDISDTIKLNISEFNDIYGLLISVAGTNSSQPCNGIINITYTETCNQYVRVNMSKLEIKVYDTTGSWNSEWGSVRVNIYNGSGSSKVLITTLRTDDQGIAKGYKNSELDFWYITNTKYNFTLEYGGDQRAFNVSSDQHSFPTNTWWQEVNYTLYDASTIEFRIRTSIANFTTEFQEASWDTSREWLLDFTFRARFMSTDNYQDDNPDWDPIDSPDFINWEITDLLGDDVYDSGDMDSEGDGYYNKTINSGFLIGGEQYYFKIYAEKTGYQNPDPLKLLFTVSERSTTIGVYNTSNPTQNLGNNVTLYYGETIQLTVFYISGALLQGATVTYEWQFLDKPIGIIDTNPGYYTITINTSIADVGTYKIDINAAQQNYSSQYFRFDIVIVNRPTSLNNDTSLHHISKTLWVRNSYNFTFEYKDILSEPNTNLIDLDLAYYQWYEVSTNGSIIGSISDPIDLKEGSNSTYILDFDTESQKVGYYALFVTVQKNNYEVRTALIDLTIQKRIITWDFDATNLVQNQIKIVQGKDVSLEVDLSDLSDPSNPEPITGATVTLTLGSRDYELTDVDGDGIYTYIFTTGSIDTFFAQKVFSGDITISKEDYISTSIPITIIVEMTEIFPGFPMFYFLMILISVIAVVGSLGAYRIIQQRRIPTFVKKARSMKKSIKANKAISESLLYPSKKEVMVKNLGDKWSSIGLSLGDIMGVEEKKKMKLPEAKEEIKGGAD